jgi:hypothetical protein
VILNETDFNHRITVFSEQGLTNRAAAVGRNLGQFLLLVLRILPYFSSLLVEVGLLSVSLRANGHVFAGGHGHGSSNQRRRRGNEHGLR